MLKIFHIIEGLGHTSIEATSTLTLCRKFCAECVHQLEDYLF